MYGNGRPLTKRQLVRLMVGLTILAWATQTLFAQWGLGADVATNQPITIDAAPAGAQRLAPAGEAFISPRPMSAVGATLELKAEATIVGPEVRLKQIARWSNRDAAFFEQAGELVLARLDARGPYRVIGMDQVRQTLADAGVNIGLVKFAGPLGCTVNRSDTKPDGDGALAQWIEANEQAAKPAVSAGAPAAAPVARPAASPGTHASFAAPQQVTFDERPAVRTLREILTEDLSNRLNLPIDQLQLRFELKDEKVLNLCEPQFKFQVDGQRVRNLGDVVWNVSIAAGGQTQRAAIQARAQAWQTQAVVNRPVSARAPIQPGDVIERRTLVDRLPEDPALRLDQAVNQQAARDLKPGTVLTGRMVEATPMARTGQLVTVTHGQGAINVKTVARAMETGAMGQRIRVKNETTNQILDVVLTGPQEAVLGDR